MKSRKRAVGYFPALEPVLLVSQHGISVQPTWGSTDEAAKTANLSSAPATLGELSSVVLPYGLSIAGSSAYVGTDPLCLEVL